MPTPRKPQTRPQAAQQARRDRRIEQLAAAYTPPLMIPDEEGNEYRRGDPEYEELLMEWAGLTAVIKGSEIYGRALTRAEFWRLWLHLGTGVKLADLDADLRTNPARLERPNRFDPRAYISAAKVLRREWEDLDKK